MRKIIFISAIFGFLIMNNAFSQDFKPSKTQFMVRGYGHSGFEYEEVKEPFQKEGSYVGATFAPIFIFKHSDKLLFEAELEFESIGGDVNIGFEYANVNYVINKYMIIRAGKFMLPFGTFMERLHPSWINRLSTKPLGFGHGGIAPSAGVGIEIRGAAPIGSAKINYSVYSTNGPALKTGIDEPEEAGMLNFETELDNNLDRTLGGRLGVLPFSNSSLEIGLSAYTGKVGDEGDSLYGDVSTLLTAVDLSYVKQISAIRGIIDIKGQYNLSNVDDAIYFDQDPGDSIPVAYTFDNTSNAYYVQLSYRPSMLSSSFLSKLELVGRYSALNTPKESEWAEETAQIDIGVNFWMSWRSVLKFSYQLTESEGGHGNPDGTTTTRGFFAHWALGF